MGPVGSVSGGYAINNTGDIVGAFMLNNVSHAFLYRNGVISDLGSLGAGTWTVAAGINDAGQVSGSSQVNGAMHAFLWSNGAMMDLGTLGAASLDSFGGRINNLGEVTGYSQVPNSTSVGHAVIYRAGAVIDLGTLGGPDSFGYDINDAGHVAGEASDSRLRLRAVLYANGTVKDLGALRPQQESRAFGINNRDQVVGESGADAEPKKAFIYGDGKLVDLTGMIQAGDPLKPYVTLQAAWDINDDGWIVATGLDKRDTNGHAYVLEPVP
jgi:probable HAF family extracellular repeat protein